MKLLFSCFSFCKTNKKSNLTKKWATLVADDEVLCSVLSVINMHCLSKDELCPELYANVGFIVIIHTSTLMNFACRMSALLNGNI